jgi:hypothetical protein
LTDSCSVNDDSGMTKVGGVLSVVIHSSKCLFCKLGLTLSKFHQERNDFAVAVIWTNGRMDCSVKYSLLNKKIIIGAWGSVVVKALRY